MRWFGRLWRKRRTRHSPSTHAVSGLDRYMELARALQLDQRMSPPWDAMLRPSGSIVVFCCDGCTEAYIDSSPDPEENFGSVERASQLGCMFCGWCGDVVWAPELCTLHADKCPTWKWEMTFQAMDCMAELVALFAGELTEEVIDDARELGAAFGPHDNGFMLARSVWAARKAME